MSGIHSSDVGTDTTSIPQKSDGVQLRNSFPQPWEKSTLKHVCDHSKSLMTQIQSVTPGSRFSPSESRCDSWQFETSRPADSHSQQDYLMIIDKDQSPINLSVFFESHHRNILVKVQQWEHLGGRPAFMHWCGGQNNRNTCGWCLLQDCYIGELGVHVFINVWLTQTHTHTLTTCKIPYSSMSMKTMVGVVQFLTGLMLCSLLSVVRPKCLTRLKYEQSEVWPLQTAAGEEKTQKQLSTPGKHDVSCSDPRFPHPLKQEGPASSELPWLSALQQRSKPFLNKAAETVKQCCTLVQNQRQKI